MATSGTYTFDPTFAGILDEALERAGIDPATITNRHITSARMSLNLMLTEWSVRDGDALYKVTSSTESLAASTPSFSLPAGATDIIGDDLVMDYAASGVETPIKRMSRQDYLRVAEKANEGRPSGFYVDHTTLNTPTVFLVPIPDAAVTLRFDMMRLSQTVGLLSETLDVQRLWLEAVCAGLALKMAEKYNLERVGMLDGKYASAYAIARRAGSGNSQVTLSVASFGRWGRTMRP